MRVFARILGAICLGVAMLRKFRHPASPAQGPMSDDEVEEFLIAAADNVKDAPDWRNSIVDRLKILRLDSSFGDRADLWREMGHDGVYGGSAEQNVQLLADVNKKIAERELVVP